MTHGETAFGTRCWRGRVARAWTDYNEHLADFGHAIAFARAYDALLRKLGISGAYARSGDHKIFTLEAHISYLNEGFLGQALACDFRVLDLDDRRAHLIFGLSDEAGTLLSTYEVIFMHVLRPKGERARSAPFPDAVRATLEAVRSDHAALPVPRQAGSAIGIRRRPPGRT